MDNDSQPDVVAVGWSDSSNGVGLLLLNTGNARFQHQRFETGPSNDDRNHPTTLALGHLDSDGFLDVVIGHGNRRECHADPDGPGGGCTGNNSDYVTAVITDDLTQLADPSDSNTVHVCDALNEPNNEAVEFFRPVNASQYTSVINEFFRPQPLNTVAMRQTEDIRVRIGGDLSSTIDTQLNRAASLTIWDPNGEYESIPWELPGCGNYLISTTEEPTVHTTIEDTIIAAPIALPPIRPWQNPSNPFDVNDDGFVAPLDVLQIINDLNTQGSRQLSSEAQHRPQIAAYPDTNGDGYIMAVDALLVINQLNGYRDLAAEGEGIIELIPRLGGALLQSETSVENALTTSPATDATTDSSIHPPVLLVGEAKSHSLPLPLRPTAVSSDTLALAEAISLIAEDLVTL
ncbi:MAG: hypothetical protein CMJ64_08770 [Planctomycetaceae bacterium]|nr:hypothetical protein [Planctomycetaceae bacterium]